MDRVARVADDQGRLLDPDAAPPGAAPSPPAAGPPARRRRARAAGAPSRGRCRRGSWCGGSSEVRREVSSNTGRPSRRPSSTGVKAPATAGRALSSTGISMKRPRTRSGSRTASSSATLAPERGPADHGRGLLQVVQQRRHLAGEQRHRVEPQVLGPIRAPVAEQVDADHPVAPPGQRTAPAARTCAGSSAARGRAPAPARPPRRSRTRSGGPRRGTRPSRNLDVPNEQGPPESGPCQVLGNERGNRGRVGQRPVSLCSPVPGLDSAGLPRQVRRLAALHLQCPLKHVTQNRTTSFLWSAD